MMKKTEKLNVVLSELEKEDISEDDFYNIEITDDVFLQGEYTPGIILSIRMLFNLKEECDLNGYYLMEGYINPQEEFWLKIILT